ncbi:Gfo/Idh/MocA family oxidoreductase [Escherichia coli]
MKQVKADWPTVTVVSEPKHRSNHSNIDLIVIPTPNDTHFPLAKAALEAGKHVVVDKPFTVTLSQARELDALAKAWGVCCLYSINPSSWDPQIPDAKRFARARRARPSCLL